jgi:hypothetical protein
MKIGASELSYIHALWINHGIFKKCGIPKIQKFSEGEPHMNIKLSDIYIIH